MAIGSSGIDSVAATHARTQLPAERRNRFLVTVLFVLLIGILCAELMLSIRHESQTWDEACHIFAGYSYWTRGDFGMNPEHPPLVKLLATAPLLGLSPHVPAHPGYFSKEEDFLTGTDFIYKNNAEQILFRTRLAVATLTVLCAVILFVAARRMFGAGPALIALCLLVFEPNILAHGMVVTTDIGLTLFLFSTVYAYYRFVENPSWLNFAFTGVSAGFALATKHSGILVFPILLFLAIYEAVRAHADIGARRFLQQFSAIVAVGIIAVAVLWSFYGFHSEPRAGVDASAQVVAYASRLQHPFQAKMISAVAKWGLLPEPYLFGLADVGFTAEFSHSYLLGKIYPHGQWFYFPAAFAIKTTLALLILLLLVPFVAWKYREHRRQLMFLIIPAAIYFLVAMTSGMNIGVRHILPIYPFLMILAGWAAWCLIERRRSWAYVIACVLIFNAVSSIRAYPAYLAYSNELWGGPSQTYRYLSDSNADWGQQLKATKKYLDSRHVDHCWFAYFAYVVVDPTYYGIQCKPLTTIASVWLQPSIEVPSTIDGPVLISAGVLSGYEFGPGPLNPYEQFQRIKPIAVIEDGIFVYDGTFSIPLASARNHVTQAQLAMRSGQIERALSEAQIAVSLAPESVQTQTQLGEVLSQLKRPEEARQAFQRALASAQSVHPEFQLGAVPGLREALAKP
jgi:hypothetical protein